MNRDTELQEEFLGELERSAPEETHQTYNCLVESLTQHQAETDIDIAKISPDQVARYIRSEWDDFAEATIQGKLCSLSNILGYLWVEDPAVCQRKVVISLDEQVGDTSGWHTPTQMLTDSQHLLVQALSDWLRRHRYGSRLHVAVELILDVHAHPSAVRKLDRDDVDFDSGEVEIQLPTKHALSQYNIRKTVSVELSPHTQDVLETYLRHNRRVPQSGNDDALLTTSYGRISRSTMSRECREASEIMFNTTPYDELKDRYSAPEIGIIYDDVSLKQVWYFSLDQIANTDV